MANSQRYSTLRGSFGFSGRNVVWQADVEPWRLRAWFGTWREYVIDTDGLDIVAAVVTTDTEGKSAA